MKICNAGFKPGSSLYRWPLAGLILALILCIAGCKREERAYRISAPAANRIYATSVSPLHPGGGQSEPPVNNELEKNAYALSEGKRLFAAYNCVGCHSHGGGGMGPALMDDQWIYGSRPEQIFATIVEGRPNGMPSFRGKIVDQQIWEIVAYIRSMSAQGPYDARPGRDDDMYLGPPENSRQRLQPKNSHAPE
jgi:cytochrome c oxidase cbb3-type subunit 3